MNNYQRDLSRCIDSCVATSHTSKHRKLRLSRRFLVSVLSIPLLSACTAIEDARPDIAAKPLPSRLDEIAYINELRSAYVITASDATFPESLCFKGTGLKSFKSKSGQGYRPDADPENDGESCIRFKAVAAGTDGARAMQDYLAAGFGLTDLYCERFFTTAAASERNRKFGRTVSNGVDTLVGSVLTLSGAGRTAIGITNAGFGLIDSGFEAYDTAYLVGPDLSEVRRLVAAAQSEYKQSTLKASDKDLPESFAGARSVIERYAGLCSYTGMKELVAKSVSDKTNQINQKVADTKKEQDAAQVGGEVKAQPANSAKGTSQGAKPGPGNSQQPSANSAPDIVPPPPA